MRVSSRAADLLQGDTNAINAFKANPALAFSQLSRNIPANSSNKSRAAKQQTPEDSTYGSPSPSASGGSTPIGSSNGPGFDQIDAHLAAQLKRLGKNDSKTKMRALSEIQAYVEANSWDESGGLQTMLLAWPPLFKRHIFDSDRRVRAAVVGVHAALVVKCGKRLAAHLKGLIGPWVAAFFDLHREAAKSARQAFDTVFPESKRPEVYAYCMAELVEYATDCIVNQTPESLSDPRFADAEEMRAKHEHAVGAAFGSLALVVEEVPADKLREWSADFDSLFGDGQHILKFVSSASPFVRRSVYRLIRTVMLKNPGLAQNSYKPLARSLLSSCFADSDPNAHGDMWDAVLLLTKSYPQAWTELVAESKNTSSSSSSRNGQKKSPVDRLFEFLRSRCRLAPTISYPSILALLANLPASVLDQPLFQPEFHKALWQGVTGQPSGSGSATTSLTPTSVETDSGSSRSSYQESVALVSAISECFSFLWTRKLKESSDPEVCSAVGKEVAKETDRLWHFYLQYPQFAQEMAVPIVKLYKKIEALASKYDPMMLERVWAQASWFALKRISGDSIYPIVYLATQIAHLDPKAHKDLADHANKLLVAFCQLAVQSQDTQTAQSLIHVLAQLAPEVVFQDQLAPKLEARLKSAGSVEDSVALVLSRAHHIASTSSGGSIAEAVKAIDAFISDTVGAADADEDRADVFRMVAALLSALPNSRIAKNPLWIESARLEALNVVLTRCRPAIPDCPELGLGSKQSDSSVPPPLDFMRMSCQALLMYFAGTEIISDAAVDGVFGWMEHVFTLVYRSQWTHDGSETEDSSTILGKWIDAAHEVLTTWTVLARDLAAGPRFVRYWLRRSGSQASSALGLLFDFAVTSSSGETSAAAAATTIFAKLQAQAQQAWAATEAQLERLHLGHELSVALSESITGNVDDLDSLKDPLHLARLASSVYTRICPQDNTRALRLLVSTWLLDASRWYSALKADAAACSAAVDPSAYLAAAANACGSGLRQAVEDYASAGHAKSFHTLAHWMASAPAVTRVGGVLQTENSEGLRRYDAFGLSRFARRAIFSVEFLLLQAGGLSALSGVDAQMLTELVLNLTLAYVLLRESLLLAASYSGATEVSSLSDESEMALGYFGPSIVRIDGEDSTPLRHASAAANSIQESVSDLLGLLAVHESSLSNNGGPESTIKAPRDPSRWLSVLMEHATGAASTSSKASDARATFWEQLASECVARCRGAVASPWPLVVGTLAQWCHWASPLGAGDLEAVVAGPLSRRLSQTAEDAAELTILTSIVRAVSLRQQQCVRSPGMQSALLDLVSRLSRTVEQCAGNESGAGGLLRLVAQLEMLTELLPIHSASLDAGTSTPKIIHVLVAVGQIVNGREATAKTFAAKIPIVLASLVVIERFTRCVPAIEDSDAIGLCRLCLGWCAMDISDENRRRVTNLPAAADAVLVAGARAACGLSHTAECLVEESDQVIGPTMHQLAKELVARCVLSERPVADGVHAVAQLVRSGYYPAPPGLDALYPVLTSASPRLAAELVQLVLAATDLGAYVGPHIDAVVRLVCASSKALVDLSVPVDELAETVHSDEYVRSASVRQLSAMVLLVRSAEALAISDMQRFDELSETLSGKQVLDAAMPWVCGLLGLTSSGGTVAGGSGAGSGAFPKLWDVAADIDWDTLVDELVRNPGGEHVLAVVAYHVVYGVAWALPSTMRSWWAGLPQASRATSVGVEQFVGRHIAPAIASRELSRIKRQAGDSEGAEEQNDTGSSGALAQTLEEYDDASVRVGTSQVTLQYTVDDSTLEMAVRLPASYPLVPPVVESVKRVAVSEKRWRAWLVATQALLARNRHVDAVCVQLVGNVGAHFAGVEDCAICYSAVGTIDNTLPNKQCRTCKNKFHRMCLFKWFHTSSQSTCPLCRNLF
ncbi:hypothetical protein IW140_005094 [Coemansia sp. RSA 1813]|nr:hypothetical protein LPJ74_004913 [Coemansia sp. RSA 1843]KAJ2566052.1 hypothetical protein IW140_005094 [Coemansia sp. RSA 1813]